MLSIFKNIKYIKLYDILSIFIFLLLIIPSLFYKLYLKITGKKIWLITEDGRTARDNGYYFFRYMREEHKDFKAYYVISKKSPDYKKVAKYGNVVRFRSIKHWIYYLSCKYNISSQKNGNPAQALFYVLHVKLNLFNNRVFLQHGIIMNDNNYVHYSETKFKYFICGAEKEYEYVKSHFGYPEGSVLFTGLARHDSLIKNVAIKNNQILIMSTWRSWLGRETNRLSKQESFTETEFYKNWNGLLNDKEFIDFIEANNIKVKFYPHINMQKYLSCFKPGSSNIELVSADTDIQKMLKESALMITDYTSATMDFALLKKPIIYFQFDRKEYREKQYAEGYFDYEKDGFGPVVETISKTTSAIKKSFKDGKFITENKYGLRAEKFFDTGNVNRGGSRKAIFEKLASAKDKHIFAKFVMLPILYFCYIFMFNIYGAIDSSVAVGILLLSLFLVNKNYRRHTFSAINKWGAKRILIVFSLLLAWSVFVILANKSNDFSFIKGLAKGVITAITGTLLYSATDYYGRASNAVNYILIAFFIQTLLEWLFFFFPSISSVFNYLRGEEALIVAARYKGYRGLALSKTPYFALTVSYGLAMILSASKYNTLFKKHYLLKPLFFIIIVSGNIFAGRAGYIALLFSPFVIEWEKIHLTRPTRGQVLVAAIVVAILASVAFAASFVPQAKILNVYTFEATSNAIAGKGLKTGSTNKLIRMYKRPFDAKTILIGDGRYETEDGEYYMKTDVGYYRKVFFGGIFTIVLVIAWHISLFGATIKKRESVALFLFLLAMELKGVSIGQNAMVFSVVVVFAIFICNRRHDLLDNIKASVILPTLNTKPSYLKTSIDSILNQSHRNLELIIIVDGSNDDEYIKKQFDDERITIIKHGETQGIAKSLNEAIKQSSGKYIIRMDADDISAPNRIERQIAYMEKNPEIDVSSTYFVKFGDRKVIACDAFTSPDDVKARLFVMDPIAHPATIIRASSIKKATHLYDPKYEKAEDYELWQRIAFSGMKVSISKFFGLKYRVHNQQVTSKKRDEQLKVVRLVHSVALEKLGLDSALERYLAELSGANPIANRQELRRFIKTAIAANKKAKIYRTRSLKKVLWSSYSIACLKNKMTATPNVYFIEVSAKKAFYKFRYLLFRK